MDNNSLPTKNLPTPIKPDKLRNYLDGYDTQLKQYILNGFMEGFTLHCNRPAIFAAAKRNSTIAQKNPDAVDQKINKELQLGHIAGPFEDPPFPQFQISPLSLRPKPDNSGWRLLHDLSYPYNDQSVNSNIPEDFKKVSYSSIESAIRMIQNLGPKTFMAKSDIQSAFTLVPIAPSDYHLLGFQWRNKYFYYTTLPQGAGSSCFIFERIATAIHWILSHKYGMENVIHYLDDFLFMHPTAQGCNDMLQTFHKICNDIGVPINQNKTEGPSSKITFLGIQLDSIANQATLPMDKVMRYTTLMEDLLGRKTCKLQEMQKVIGSLQFTTSVVSPGRVFLRRLINSTIGIVKPYHHVHVTSSVKKDLQIWLIFLQKFNGIHIFIPQQPLLPTAINLYTDSCPRGFGGTYKTKYFYGQFPSNWRDFNIAVLELYPIFLALQLYASELANHHIVLYTDNQAVSDILNTKTTRHIQLLHLLRKIVLHALQFNIVISSKHIPGKLNILPDALSRNSHTKLLLQNHNMEEHPTPIPQHLLPENFKW